MPAGTHATLVIDDQRSHIQLSVISLENGIAGHRIRVASPDHKQFYVGEVVSARLLKGNF
jgi:flagella basal body P-ring formation protein FlgA